MIYIIGKREEVKGDAGINLNILTNMELQVRELTGESQLLELKKELLHADIIIDGIYGTGLRGNIENFTGDIFDAINMSGKPVISIDIPSGINGETGRIQGKCIKASKTVTFCTPKIGLVIHPGCEFVGDLVVADIGIPQRAVEQLDIKNNLIDGTLVSKLIPLRPNESNKGTFGSTLIISGSVGMTGSGCLAAKAALRTGAGLVYMGVPSSLRHIYEAALMEPITIPLECKDTGSLSSNCLGRIMELMHKMTVIAVGPGLSVNDDIMEVVRGILTSSEIPLVLDADALNVVSRDISMIKQLKARAVITPHPGEMSRLTGMSVPDIQGNRIETAREFAEKWGVITVLKGSRTVVALPDGRVFVNPTGNPGMATGGSGDVLTGIIAGLISQGVKPEDAVVAGVYIHGVAGDTAAGEKGEYGMIASDIVDELPYVVKDLIVCRKIESVVENEK